MAKPNQPPQRPVPPNPAAPAAEAVNQPTAPAPDVQSSEPNPNSNTPAEESTLEVKQGAITPPMLKRAHVPGLVGGFGNTVFDNNSITTEGVSEADLQKLQQTFGDTVQLVD